MGSSSSKSKIQVSDEGCVRECVEERVECKDLSIKTTRDYGTSMSFYVPLFGVSYLVG
jgi:hypothetical protein